MASHPTFDSNQLEENWSDWVSDPGAPLFNRAAQAKYYPGTALAPLMLAAALDGGTLPVLPPSLDFNHEGQEWICSLQPAVERDWGKVISNGCPNPLAYLLRSLSSDSVASLLNDAGFYTSPSVPLQSARPDPIPRFDSSVDAVFGFEAGRVSPLQMALAVAALSEGGQRPSPRLAMSVNTTAQGWVFLPSGSPKGFLTKSGADEAAMLLAASDLPIWESSGGTPRDLSGSVSWYLSGTLPSWQGTPLTLALVLEDYDPGLAKSIGRQMILTAQKY